MLQWCHLGFGWFEYGWALMVRRSHPTREGSGPVSRLALDAPKSWSSLTDFTAALGRRQGMCLTSDSWTDDIIRLLYILYFLLRCWLVLVGTPQLLARNGNCDSLTSRKEEDSPASACPSFAVDRTTETSSCLQAPCERHAARAKTLLLCQGTLDSYIILYIDLPLVLVEFVQDFQKGPSPHYWWPLALQRLEDIPILQVTLPTREYSIYSRTLSVLVPVTLPHTTSDGRNVIRGNA